MLHLELLALAAWCCSLCTQVEPFSEICLGRGTRLLDRNRSFQTYQSLFLSCSRSSLILPQVGIRRAASLRCSQVIRLVEKVGVRKLVRKWEVRTVKGGGRCPILCIGPTLTLVQPYSPSLPLLYLNLPHQDHRKLQLVPRLGIEPWTYQILCVRVGGLSNRLGTETLQRLTLGSVAVCDHRSRGPQEVDGHQRTRNA